MFQISNITNKETKYYAIKLNFQSFQKATSMQKLDSYLIKYFRHFR